jgi:uncharacterized protein
MTVATDFYLPSFRINDQDALNYGLATDIVSVSITETINQADSFAITMREHYPNPERLREGRLSWTENTAFDEGAKIKIELGYLKNRGVKLEGYVTGIAMSFAEDGRSTLTVRGYNKYHDLQRNRRYKPFESSTYNGMVREIAAAVSLTPEVDDTDTEHPIVSPNGITYAAILEDCAKRLNFDVAVKQSRLIFQRPRYLAGSASPALELIWGQSLRSFSVDMKTNNMASTVTVRNTQTGQGGTKKPLVGTATTSDVPAKLGRTSGLEWAQRVWKRNDVHLDDQRLSKPGEAKQVAQADMERRALEYITGNGSCIGNPGLLSRTIIKLSNLGPRCSGNYYVTSTTHTVDAGGYRTEFTAKRDGR